MLIISFFVARYGLAVYQICLEGYQKHYKSQQFLIPYSPLLMTDEE
jgi:hypothetical protein